VRKIDIAGFDQRTDRSRAGDSDLGFGRNPPLYALAFRGMGQNSF
jgi:hypothetical protein